VATDSLWGGLQLLSRLSRFFEHLDYELGRQHLDAMRIMRKAVLRDIRREWRAAVRAEGETTNAVAVERAAA
jgi:hypothetical protein